MPEFVEPNPPTVEEDTPNGLETPPPYGDAEEVEDDGWDAPPNGLLGAEDGPVDVSNGFAEEVGAFMLPKALVVEEATNGAPTPLVLP